MTCYLWIFLAASGGAVVGFVLASLLHTGSQGE